MHVSRKTAIVLALVLALLALWTSRSGSLESLEPFTEASAEETIFVSIASYRDVKCSQTIADMYAKAKNPGRVFVGACEQNKTENAADESCSPATLKYSGNVRKIEIPHDEAKGPCYARYLCSTLYADETYFFQIDSHTTFAQDWDHNLIADWKAALKLSRKPVLSTYPHSDEHVAKGISTVPVLCDGFWNSDGLPSLKASVRAIADVKSSDHLPTAFIAGGFMFGPGSMLRDVPYDPHLDHVFVPEEILYAMRLWTSGYDMFTPRDNYIYHAYTRKGAPRWNTDHKAEKKGQKAAMLRVRRLMHLDRPYLDDDVYSAGKVRSVDEYYTYAGLDRKTLKSTSKDKFC